MSGLYRSLSFLPLVLSLALLPLCARSESQLAAPGASASASLNFRIIIPPILRVLENNHPEVLALAGGESSVQQRLVVVSNMKRGFCVTLRLTTPEIESWRLSAAPEAGLSLSPVSDGYRLCTARAGRYTLELQHQFNLARSSAGSPPATMAWPLLSEFAAI